jgi:hypothetical protein
MAFEDDHKWTLKFAVNTLGSLDRQARVIIRALGNEFFID